MSLSVGQILGKMGADGISKKLLNSLRPYYTNIIGILKVGEKTQTILDASGSSPTQTETLIGTESMYRKLIYNVEKFIMTLKNEEETEVLYEIEDASTKKIYRVNAKTLFEFDGLVSVAGGRNLVYDLKKIKSMLNKDIVKKANDSSTNQQDATISRDDRSGFVDFMQQNVFKDNSQKYNQGWAFELQQTLKYQEKFNDDVIEALFRNQGNGWVQNGELYSVSNIGGYRFEINTKTKTLSYKSEKGHSGSIVMMDWTSGLITGDYSYRDNNSVVEVQDKSGSAHITSIKHLLSIAKKIIIAYEKYIMKYGPPEFVDEGLKNEILAGSVTIALKNIDKLLKGLPSGKKKKS